MDDFSLHAFDRKVVFAVGALLVLLDHREQMMGLDQAELALGTVEVRAQVV